MPSSYLHLLVGFFFIALAKAELNLLTFATGGLGQVLGSAFGLPGTNATFDYVIVGGGTAGLTIATRLASDPAVSVALVEAGGFYEIDNGNRSTVPGYASFYSGADADNYQPLIDWGFVTEPQEGAAQRKIHYARGKTLGGSSARNYMIYHRPTVGSMQKWADEVDDQSYSWDNMLPFFKKSCNYTSFDKNLYNATISQDPSAFDPQGGPLHTSFSNYADSFGSWAQKGYVGVGMELQDGLNSGILHGTAYSTLTIDPRNGYRSSSESSFLQAALQNGTAPTIYKNSLATRILLDDNTATGVTVTTAGPYGIPAVNYTLSARKEVIVCAGTFQSPQLLMVSGIGPQDQLERNNIEVKKDLPGVGQNMWDHVLFGISRRVNVLTASASANSPVLAAGLAELFRTNGSGPLAAFGAGNPQTVDPRDGYNYATINPGIIAPLSRGNISINSSEMSTPPIINPNWLTSTTDQELAIQGFKRAREIWQVLEDAGLTVDGANEYFPGKNVTEDKDILDFIQRSLMTIYHAAGTCKMGKPDDDMAVLDSRARVRGISNLRVVDASSFPFLPPGHPQSVVYALAEKIAADILGLDAMTGQGYGMGGYLQDQDFVSKAKKASGGSGEEEESAENDRQHHWDAQSSISVDQQRKKLVQDFIQAGSERLVQQVDPSATQIATILEPWRSPDQRELVDTTGDAVWLRTCYTEGSDAEHAELVEGVDMEMAVDGDHRLLNDPKLYNYGSEWRQVFDVLPELLEYGNDWTFRTKIQRDALQKLRAYAEGGLATVDQRLLDNLTGVAQGTPEIGFRGEELENKVAEALQSTVHSSHVITWLVLEDEEALETGNVAMIFLDAHGRAVRSKRVSPDEAGQMGGFWADGCWDEIGEWQDGEFGVEYRSGGACGDLLLGSLRGDDT
ncbi:MAG: hypothetical protein Q9169_005457 [Polycauliona sp. 2 TL-2023]